jgi:HAD superfamily hydrolase (TIGR01509 family)
VTLDAAAPTVAPAAVLWDMDGTLVDTEPYWMACERELVDAFGGRWTEEDARSIIGYDLLDAAEVLRERGGVDLDPHEIVERMLDGVIARIRRRVPWRPGARRLLSELNALGVPCALVTMSWRRLTDAVVEALAPIHFQAVIAGDEVRRGKPHPEPYLRAAAELGVDPTECVAIEDSPTGVRSASRAGCVVVAVPNLVPLEPGPGRVVVPSLKGLTTEDLGRFLAEAPPPATRDQRRSGPHGDGRPPSSSSQRRRAGRGTAEQRRRGAWIAGGIAAVAAVGIGATIAGGGDDGPPPRQPGALSVHAWTPYWAIDDAIDDLPARADALHQLSPFWWRATGVDTIEIDRQVPTEQAEEFVDTAGDLGIPVVASILDGTGPGVMAGILADPEQRARHVEAIAEFAADGDFAGIDIDYEQFAFADGRDTWAATRPNWVAFVEELGARLHDDGRLLTVSIPWISGDGSETDEGFWVYDYAGITPHVDAIRVMAYDYSVASGPPGAIAPLPWVESIITATAQASGDPSKLVLGIPLYGRNWVVETRGTCPASAEGNLSQSARYLEGLAARRGATPEFDPVTHEMRFTYELEVTDGSTTCTQVRDVRYVDGTRAQIRMQRAVDAGFGGVALFALGYDDPATWTAIDTISRRLQAASTASTPTSGSATGG